MHREPPKMIHRRPCLVAPVALLLTLALGACDAEQEPVESPTAAGSASATSTADASASESVSASAGAAGEETSVFDLQERDCFTASGDEVETVTVVDCQEPHVYEVFAVFDHEAGEGEAYPGDEAILEYADAECQAPFEDYVGVDYESSRYWITSVTPSQATWDDGDREIVCALKLGEAGEETTGSAEGSGD